MERHGFLMDLATHFPDVMQDVDEHVKDQYVLTIPRDELPIVVRRAVNQLGARFVISVGTDMRPRGGAFRVSYILSFDKDKTFLILQSEIPENDLKVPSITPQVPAADWSER